MMRQWLSRWWPGSASAQEDETRQDERWIILDVETSGLDVQRDQLLAIAAMGARVDWRTRSLTLHPGDSLSLTLRPQAASERADKANILLHGIGVAQQRQGLAPAEAMTRFAQWAQGARLVAFHAAFDRALLQRYARAHLGQTLPHAWLDIAHLCTVAHPQVKARALDDWLAHFGIECQARHEAAADVLAECELLQRIWPRVARECDSWRQAQAFAGRHAWLGPR